MLPFHAVRERFKMVVEKDGSLVKPLRYQEDDEGTLCYNSGGRGVVFPYNGRAVRVKGLIDPHGELTKKVGYSQRNKISDIRDHALALPRTEVNGKPFAVLSQDAAEKERQATERLNWSYWKHGLKAPYSVSDIAETGQAFRGEMTVQLFFDLPSIEHDFRAEELSGLIMEKLQNLSSEEIRERLPNILKLYGRIFYWHGFASRCLVDSGLLPTANSFAAQNYVVAPIKGGYGLFRADHTSTETRNVDPEFGKELSRRMTRESPELMLGVFTNVPTAVIIASYYPDQVPETEQLFEKCYYFTGSIKDKEGRYAYFMDIFKKSFITGVNTDEPEPIGEEWFEKVLNI